MKLKYILFDLDGTLTDSMLGITNSVIYSLKKFGIEVKDRSELFPFIGPPLLDSFMKYYSFSKEDAELAVARYREYFGPTGVFENELYPGIDAMLEKLKQTGVKLLLATSKPEEYANPILEHFGIAKYFDFVGGNTLQDLRPRKDQVIAYVKEIYTDINAENSIMVGDRHHDVDGAKANGLKTVAVLYGYGSREELCGAECIVETVEELEKYLLERI